MAPRRTSPPSPGDEEGKPSLSFSSDEIDLDFDFGTEPEFSSSPAKKPEKPVEDDGPAGNGSPDPEPPAFHDLPAPSAANGGPAGLDTADGEPASVEDALTDAPEDDAKPSGEPDGAIPSSDGAAGSGAPGDRAATSFEPRRLQDPGPGAPSLAIPPPPGVDAATIAEPSAPRVAPPPVDKRRRRLEREGFPLRRRRNKKTSRTGEENGSEPPGVIPPPPAPAGGQPPAKKRKPRLKKLRFLFVLAGLGVLAMASTVFGMMMAVSQDLPAIENFAQYQASQNSVMVDSNGQDIGTLTSDQNRILLTSSQISPNIKNAVVAIEDSRFYEHQGIDVRGTLRALGQDILHLSAQQGASTITQQFVKNALETQSSRTVFEKLREAALSYHLEKKWSKDKILTEYLNTIYFGEGAYGIEAAARTYFGWNHPGCGTDTEPCASVLLPAEAATIAGLIASPAAFDPKINPNDSKGRRNLVLEKMLEQGYISQADYHDAVITAVPSPDSIVPPTIDSKAPYFSTWARQQLVDKYGTGKAYFGGLKVKTTLDLDLQKAAEQAVSSYLGGIPPTASVVVLDNGNAGVKAMVGGPNYETAPFNIATNGHRQPGSSIKPFTLITALKEGISPYTVYPSAPQEFKFGKKGRNTFTVHNDEDSYLGSCDLVCATTYSDNSIYAQLGLEGLKGNSISDRTHSIAATIHAVGYRDPISTNPAMVLGGLNEGVTPLQWAYAYMTIANDGDRVSGTLAADPGDSPVAFTKVTDSNGHLIKNGDNDLLHKQVIPEAVATEAKSILETVVSSGTGTHAQVGVTGQWGKTGTTENNGDAWFCGAVQDVTACVWVGYANSVTSMSTDYLGGPVMGGTYPALIWASVISAWEQIKVEHAAARAAKKAASSSGTSTSGTSTYTPPSTGTPTYTAPSTSSAPTTAPVAPTNTAPVAPTPAPATPAPAAPAPAAPAPTAPAAPTSGGGISSGGAGPG